MSADTENPVQPPEVAGETPQDPNIVGSLTPQEMAMLQRTRAQNNQLVNEIGNIEVRKARLLGTLSEMEERVNQIIQEAGKRLGLKDGVQFQVLPDGRVRAVPAVAVPPPVPSAQEG